MTQPPPSRLRPFSPMRFGRYTLVARLAQGGMGELFLAQLDGGGDGFQKLCVIKRMLPQLAHDPGFVERFTNEARVLVKLSHGAIAQVLELGSHEGTPFLALEYVDGKDLRRVSVRAREQGTLLPPGFVLQVMCRVLEALAYAHRKKDDDGRELLLVHRDISPPNVLVSYEGEVKVIDFGLARSRLSAARTNPRSLLGKFLYMSPEQALHRPVDRRSDLYAVGLCLYELLAGAHPFEQLGPADLMSRVAKPSIPQLDAIVPSSPAPLAAVVMRALAVDPDARYQSADEFRVALLGQLASLEPTAGAEHVSRVMHRLFAPEFQLERRLLAAAREPQSLHPAQVSRARSETAVLPARGGAGPAAAAGGGVPIPPESPATAVAGTRGGQPAWSLQSGPPPIPVSPPGVGRGASASIEAPRSASIPAATAHGGAAAPPIEARWNASSPAATAQVASFPGAQGPGAAIRGGHASVGPAMPPPLSGASAADAAPPTIVDAPSGRAVPGNAGAFTSANVAGGREALQPGALAMAGRQMTPPPLPGSAARSIGAPPGRPPAQVVGVQSNSSSGGVPSAAKTATRMPPIAGGSSRSVPAVPAVSPFGSAPDRTGPLPSLSSQVVTLVPGMSDVRTVGAGAPSMSGAAAVAAAMPVAPVTGSGAERHGATPGGSARSATALPVGPVTGASVVAPEAATQLSGAADVRAAATAVGPVHPRASEAALLDDEEPAWTSPESAMTELSPLPGPVALGVEEALAPNASPNSTAARGPAVQASPLSFEPTPMLSSAAPQGLDDPFDGQTRRVDPTAEVLRGLLEDALPDGDAGSTRRSAEPQSRGTSKSPQPSAWSDEVTTGTGGLSAGFTPPSVAPLQPASGTVSPPPPPERALQDSAEFLLPPEEATPALSDLEPSTAAALAAWFEAAPEAGEGGSEASAEPAAREPSASPASPSVPARPLAAAPPPASPGAPRGAGFDQTAPQATSPFVPNSAGGTPEQEAAGPARRATAKAPAATRSPGSKAARPGGGVPDDLRHEATTQKEALAPTAPLDPDATDPKYRLTRPDPDDTSDERGRGAGLWWGLAILVLLGAGVGAGWEWGRQHPDRVPAMLAALYPPGSATIPQPEAIPPVPTVRPEETAGTGLETEAPPEVLPEVPAAGPGASLAVDTMEDAETLLVPLRAERNRRVRGVSEGAGRVPPGVLGREWTATLALFEALEAERTCEGSLSLMCKRFARVRTRVEAATSDDPALRRQVRDLKRALQQMER